MRLPAVFIFLLGWLTVLAAAERPQGGAHTAIQTISVGFLMTGRTMTNELFHTYGPSESRIEDWLVSGMAVPLDVPRPVALLSIEENAGYPTPVELDFEFTVYDTQNFELPKHPEDHDLYVVSGSNFSVTDEHDWMLKIEDLIRVIDEMARSGAHQKPVPPKLVGICFGHQLIHKALGGEVKAKARDTFAVGTHVYNIYDYHPIMRPVDAFMPRNDPHSVVLDVLHNDQVIEPADGFNVLAGNDFCPIGITIKDDHILTFQPHPEYPNKKNRYVKSLLNFALDAGWIDAEHHAFSLSTILQSSQPESARAMAWTAQFIADERRGISYAPTEAGKKSADVVSLEPHFVTSNNMSLRTAAQYITSYLTSFASLNPSVEVQV